MNIVIFCLVYLFVLIWDTPSWDMPSIGAYLFVFFICIIVLAWPQKVLIPYFMLVEGQFGECYGGKSKALDDAQFVLSEAKSRLSMLGCWLVFIPIANNNNKAYFKHGFEKQTSIFVPKQYLTVNDFKSLCRHLIWHAKT